MWRGAREGKTIRPSTSGRRYAHGGDISKTLNRLNYLCAEHTSKEASIKNTTKIVFIVVVEGSQLRKIVTAGGARAFNGLLQALGRWRHNRGPASQRRRLN